MEWVNGHAVRAEDEWWLCDGCSTKTLSRSIFYLDECAGVNKGGVRRRKPWGWVPTPDSCIPKNVADTVLGVLGFLDLIDGCAKEQESSLGRVHLAKRSSLQMKRDDGMYEFVGPPPEIGTRLVPAELCEFHMSVVRESPFERDLDTRIAKMAEVCRPFRNEGGPSAVERVTGIGISAPKADLPRVDDPTGDDVCADAPGAEEYLKGRR